MFTVQCSVHSSAVYLSAEHSAVHNRRVHCGTLHKSAVSSLPHAVRALHCSLRCSVHKSALFTTEHCSQQYSVHQWTSMQCTTLQCTISDMLWCTAQKFSQLTSRPSESSVLFTTVQCTVHDNAVYWLSDPVKAMQCSQQCSEQQCKTHSMINSAVPNSRV